MRAATDRLNSQALALEEAQSEIRLAVKDATLRRLPRSDLDKRILAIINRALAKVKIPDLKRAAYRSLVQFYNKQRQLAAQIPQRSLFLFIALSYLKERGKAEKSTFTKEMTLAKARDTVKELMSRDEAFEVLEYGQPLHKYHELYMKDVSKAFRRMADEEALDPDSETYWGKKHTLRNRAEREVRYQDNVDNLQDLRDKGVKLIIVSSHADCSSRCSPWQGGVYSLDGTSGTASDGRKYIPIEIATDIYTKNGKWKNGLFGFNCRHYAVEYRDHYRFPEVSLATEAEQYEISMKQRELERKVRFWRERALMSKGSDPKEYKKAQAKALAWNKAYEKYSHKHNRANYSSRTKIL